MNYRKTEVSDIVQELIAKKANVRIFDVDDAIYMVPNFDNELLSYTNEELRKHLNVQSNSGLYLAHFVILVLLSKFYNSEDLIESTRQYVTIDEFNESINNYMEEFRDFTEEEANTYYEENGIDVSNIVVFWDEMPTVKEEGKTITRGKSKINFIYKVLKFLESEELVYIYEDIRSQIRLTAKTEVLITKYFYNAQRKEQIMELLKK